jgi:peptide methionine sulfoxide reductase MsrA
MTYTIARLDDEGRWEFLESFDSYSEAEDAHDAYCDMYPQAYIDVISTN